MVIKYPLNDVGELLFHFWPLLQGASQREEAREERVSEVIFVCSACRVTFEGMMKSTLFVISDAQLVFEMDVV